MNNDTIRNKNSSNNSINTLVTDGTEGSIDSSTIPTTTIIYNNNCISNNEQES